MQKGLLTLRTTLGEMSFLTPSQWKLGIYFEIVKKLNLQSTEFLRYAVYYAQSNYFDNSLKINFQEFQSVTDEEIESIAKELVINDIKNSSMVEQKDFNPYQLIRNQVQAFRADNAAFFFAMSLRISDFSLLNALSSKYDENYIKTIEQLSQAVLIFQKTEDYKFVADFYKKELSSGLEKLKLPEFQRYLNFCNHLNEIFKKISSNQLWLPSRYLEKLLPVFLSNEVNSVQYSVSDLILSPLIKKFDEK
ncbi:hypothetical protein JNL27_17215, partial [bacterium]|nr:hypothetical protein [bacterium]